MFLIQKKWKYFCFYKIISSQACASLEPNYQPPVTFIVVQKRHHTRLFANNHRDRTSTDKSGNILPGKVYNIFLAVYVHKDALVNFFPLFNSLYYSNSFFLMFLLSRHCG
jgi:hypothetical protein